LNSLIPLPLLANMQPMLIVCAALAIEKLIPISSSIDPLSFFRFVCQRMASKVLGQQCSSKQLMTSGSLALLLLVLPLLIVAYLVLQFASYQWLLDILLLWLLIQFTGNIKIVTRGIDALQTDKKQLAKELLQQTSLRNTQSLSSLGLAKASLEAIFLRYHHQQFTTILCYLLLGPIAALCYRLCYEANQVWNIKLKEFHYFGRLTNIITQMFQLIPSLVMSISFVLISSPKALILHLKQKPLIKSIKQAIGLLGNQSLLLQTLSSALNVNTGGPVMYGTTKKQRTRFSLTNNATENVNKPEKSVEPSTNSVKTLISLVNRHLIVTALISTWILFWYFPN
jgi:adenosylcobinamide-phosphate synthase